MTDVLSDRTGSDCSIPSGPSDRLHIPRKSPANFSLLPPSIPVGTRVSSCTVASSSWRKIFQMIQKEKKEAQFSLSLSLFRCFALSISFSLSFFLSFFLSLPRSQPTSTHHHSDPPLLPAPPPLPPRGGGIKTPKIYQKKREENMIKILIKNVSRLQILLKNDIKIVKIALK